MSPSAVERMIGYVGTTANGLAVGSLGRPGRLFFVTFDLAQPWALLCFA